MLEEQIKNGGSTLSWFNLLWATRLMLNIIKTSKVTHMKICTQIFFKTPLLTIGIQVQNKQNNHMFFLCALESKNVKYETPKPYHGDKLPKHKKTKTMFTLN